MQHKIFTGKMSFNKPTPRVANLGIDYSGISMAMPNDFDAYKAECDPSKDWLNFGVFGDNSQYHPEAVADNIFPKKEDFVEAPFRLISATIVGAGSWKATDFSDAQILKASTKKLEGKPLYKDHQTDLDNWVGLVTGVKWTPSFTNSDGVKVPAGIDGIVAIDAKTNPKVARGVLIGSVFSNSVTVKFSWKMSHHFEDEYEFYRKIGTYAEDGDMIRRIVTQIDDYYESSLVWLGADPFAKAIDPNGNLVHIDSSAIEYNKISDDVKDNHEKNKKFNAHNILDAGILSLAAPKKINNIKDQDMDKFKAAFIAKFGIEKADMTEAEMIAHLETVIVADDTMVAQATQSANYDVAALACAKSADDKVTTVPEDFLKTHSFVANSDLEVYKTASTELTAANASIVKLTASAKIGNDFVELRVAEAIRLYKISVGNGNADEKVIALFKKADNDQITGLLAQYTKSATHKFSGKCKDCGSKDFEFRSSFAPPTGDPVVEVTDNVVTATDLQTQFGKSKWNIRG